MKSVLKKSAAQGDDVKHLLSEGRVEIRVSSDLPSWTTWFREIWTARDLLWILVRRDLISVYKQTLLGPLWYIVQPLANGVVFLLIFGKLAKLGTDGIPESLFYWAGSIFWSWAQASLQNSSLALHNHAHIISKVYFPRIVLPLSTLIGALMQLILNCILLLLLLVMTAGGRGAGFRWAAPLWCVVSVTLAALAIFGIALWLAALTAKYRDLRFALPFLTQLWMLLSPVVWPLSRVSGRLRMWMIWNPITGPLEMWRIGWFGRGTLDLPLLVGNVILAGFLVVSGIWIFRRVERSFADVA